MKVNLPSDFTIYLNELLGKESKDLIESFSTPLPVSIRINPKKNYLPPPELNKIPWCEKGYYLPVRPVFTLDPALHAGGYYVQESSSMFLEQAVKQIINKDEPVKVLDISAAPGGKSTHLLSLLPDNSLLIANEVIRARAEILKENIIKWGAVNVIVTCSDPEKFGALDEFFDVIVVDAPCSGEGLFRKDANAINEWSQENVNICEMRQKRILNNLWSALKPGGFLIYSTCTFQKKENEQQLVNFINEKNGIPLALEIKKEWNISVTETKSNNGILHGNRFYPHKVKGEGFFLSVIKKNEDTKESFQKLKITKNVNEIKSTLVSSFISSAENLLFFEHSNSIFAFPKEWQSELNYLSDKINIIYAGVEAGKIAGKDFIPAHALALSTIVSSDIPSVELNTEDALKYLRKSEIKISDANKGWTIVKHQDLNLGWIKILPNRINNYYPKEYRIRM